MRYRWSTNLFETKSHITAVTALRTDICQELVISVKCAIGGFESLDALLVRSAQPHHVLKLIDLEAALTSRFEKPEELTENLFRRLLSPLSFGRIADPAIVQLLRLPARSRAAKPAATAADSQRPHAYFFDLLTICRFCGASLLTFSIY